MAMGDVGSTRLADSISGDRWAGVEMKEQDGGNSINASVMSVATRHPTVTPDITRTAVAADDTVDNLDASPPVTPVTTGDKATLIVQVEHSLGTGDLDVTPIGYNETGTAVVMVFETKIADAPSSPAWRRGSGAGNYISEVLSWDCYGVPKISIAVSGHLNGTHDVKAWLI